MLWTRYALLTALLFSVASTEADEFEILMEQGERKTIQAQIYGEDGTLTALMKDDGSIELFLPSEIVARRPSAGPEIISPQERLQRLKTEFGPDLFRGLADKPYVVGIVLQAAITPEQEERLQRALIKSLQYMRNIENSFDRFMKEIDVAVHSQQFPQVLLIFESDKDFEDYSKRTGGAAGASDVRIAGFYSQLSNALYVRMSECATFDTPLHEGIHQLCFNKGLFQRMARIPPWLAEGIACSFEGSGTTSHGNPRKLNAEYAAELRKRYAGTGMSQRDLLLNPDWDAMVTDEERFRANDTAVDSYIDCWSLHWILVWRHPEKYAAYVKEVQTLQPFEDRYEGQQLELYMSTFGAEPSTFWGEFVKELSRKARYSAPVKRAMNQGRVKKRESNLALLSLKVEVGSSGIVGSGELKNVSPFREMCFYVCAQIGPNQKLEWLLPRVGPGKTKGLPTRRIPARGSTYLTFVRSTPADSPEAAAWARGKLPDLNAGRGRVR